MAVQPEILATLLGQLLQPDTDVIQQATSELKKLVKDPSVVPALCNVIASSNDAQVRQYACVVLRRRILKKSYWKSLPQEIGISMKQNLLQVLLQESEKAVRNSLAQLVAIVAKHELAGSSWPELFQFIQEGSQSQEPANREVCLQVLSSMTASAAKQLQPQYIHLLQLLAAALQDPQSLEVKFHALQSLSNLVPYIGSDELRGMQQILPQILVVLEELIVADEEKAVEGFDVIEELIESEVGIIAPKIKNTVEFCLKVAAKSDLGDAIRVRALSIITSLTSLKKKAVQKLKLAAPLVDALFPIMCEHVDDEEDEDDFEAAEADKAPSYAGQVLDSLAMNCPPDKFIPSIMQKVEQGLSSTDPYHRKAAYLAMAVVSEGCAHHMRSKYLPQLLQCVYRGIGDSHQMVQHAALFALGEFSDYLQPDISKHAADILPLLFNYLGQVASSPGSNIKGVVRTHCALELFCENLGEGIVPYLPTLMEHLLTTLGGANSSKAKELAISAIGAAANAAQAEIMPYFQGIIEQLKGFLASGQSEDALKLQTQAIDTLSVLARKIGGEHFMPLAPECLQLCLSLLSEATDPDLRRCIYGLLASLSTLLKSQMQPYMEQVISPMITSVKSTEGITTHYADDEGQMMNLFEDEEEDIEEDEEDDNDEDFQGYSVENAYLDEKEDACVSLGEIAENTGTAFLPYMETSYSEVSHLIDHPAPCIRKGAATALCSFCCAVHQVEKEDPSEATKHGRQAMLAKTVPVLLKISREDQDRHVAMSTLEGLADMLEKIGEPVLEGANTVQNIMNVVIEVLQHKVACQDCFEDYFDEVACQDPEDVDVELEDQEAEYDSLLLEHAGDIGPRVAKHVGGQAFYPYFATIVPELLKKLKKNSDVAEKSFAAGTLAEMIHASGAATGPLAPHLYTTLMGFIQDDDSEVRSNSIFGVGVLAEACRSTMSQHFPQILKEYFDILQRESDRRVIDNICAACCRMIMTSETTVPTDQVLPVVLQCLPLGEDMEENETVYKCLVEVYKAKPELLLQGLPQLLGVSVQVLGKKQLTAETEQILVELLHDIQHNHPEVWSAGVGNISPEAAAGLSQYFTTLQNGPQA